MKLLKNVSDWRRLTKKLECHQHIGGGGGGGGGTGTGQALWALGYLILKFLSFWLHLGFYYAFLFGISFGLFFFVLYFLFIFIYSSFSVVADQDMSVALWYVTHSLLKSSPFVAFTVNVSLSHTWMSNLVMLVALFDISIWHIDCRYIDTFEKYRYRYRYGHFWKYRYRYRYR